jgi:hypothetical protein
MLPNFWDDPKKAEQVLKSIRDKKQWTDAFEEVNNSWEDFKVMVEFFELGEASEEELEQNSKKNRGFGVQKYAQRRRRPFRSNINHKFGCWWYRKSGLGCNVDENVHKMGREKQL